MAADISTLTIEVDSRGVVRARDELGRFAAAGDKAETTATKVTSAWRAFSGVLATLGLGLVARELVQMADTMSLLDARLKMATRSSAEFLAAQADIYRIAQANNVGLKETTELYVKLSDPIRALGGSTKEVAAISEAFAASLRVGGASAQEASAATMQFAQAMASGVLRGDEFNSIAEASPRFMKAMADGMGVPTGALRKMAEAGELTADVVGNALVSGLAKLQAESASMPDTVGGAFQRLNNDVSLTVAKFNEATGATAALAAGIGVVNDIVIRLSSVMSSSLADGVYKAGDSFDYLTATIRVVGTVFETLMVLGLNISFVLKGMGREIGGIAAQLAALVTGDFKAFGAIRDGMVADSEAARKALDTETASIVGMTEKAIQARDVVRNFSLANSEVSSEMARLAGRVNAASGAFVTLKSAQEQTKGKGSTKAVVDEYEKLITSIKEKIALQEAELNQGRELTKAEQLAASVTADLASGKLKLSRAQKENIDSAIALYDSTERLNEAKRSSAKLYEQSLSSAIKENQTIQQQIEALKLQTEEVGKSEYALALLAEARLYDAAAQKEAMAAMADGEDLTGRLGELYRKQAAALRDLAAAKMGFAAASSEGGLKNWLAEQQKKALDDFQSYIDKIDSSRLDGLFNGALKGIDKLITATKALGTLNEKSDKAKLAAIDKYGKGSVEVIKIENATLQNQIGLYGDIAGAAKSMFAEGSKGYQALSVAQSALAVATGIAAIANQGLGDPYTAIPRMIAMAATLAQLGIAVNGISGGGSAPITNQGTGTVFGDPTAKSASIENSIELLADTSKLGLRYSAQMANSLKNIEAAFAGVTNLLLRNGQIGALEGSIATGNFDTGLSSLKGSLFSALLPGPLGSALGSLATKLFGKKISIQGSGIQGGPQSFGDIQDIGFQGNYYADIQTKRKFLGITTSTRNSTQLSALDAELADQFTKIFVGIGDSVTAAAGALGIRTETVQDALSKYIVDIGKIDLKDLTGEEIQAKLSAVFGAESDKIAAAVVPGFERIQKVGEGYFETLVRAATQLESVNTTFGLLGGSLSLFTKSADIFLEKMSGGFRTAPGIDRAIVADQLVQQFGGLEDFNEATNSFYEAFYSRGERTQNTLRLLGTSLEGIDVALPSSISAWRDLTTSLDITTEAGRQAFETLITLGPTFAELQEQLLSDAGISGSAIADVLRDGMLARITQAEIGQQLSSIIVDGIYNSLANGFAEQISNTFTNQIIAPLLQSVATGGVLSASISQASIDTVVATATNAANQLAAILGDQGFQAAIAGVQAAISGIAGAFPGKSATAATAVAAQSYSSLGSAVNSASNAADKGADAWKSIGDSITNEIDRIRGVLTGGDKASALASFATITAQTRAGDQEAAKLLPNASQAYIKAVEETAGSLLEVKRAQGFALSSLMETRSIIGQGPSTYTPTSFAPSFVPSFTSGGAPQQSNDALITEVKALRAEVAALRPFVQTSAEVLDKAAKAGDGSGAFGVEVQT